jgi:hypothetical protein
MKQTERRATAEGGTAQPEDEESMKKANCIAAVLGMGLALAPWTALAQAPAVQPAAGAAAPATVAAPAIPQDQQPTKEQLARLFEVMRLRQQLQGFMKMMPAMVQQQVQAQTRQMTAKMCDGCKPTPEQQAAIDKLMKKYMEKAFNLYPIDEMIDDMTGLYQHHLSRSDVDAFIVFYNSPAGQHLLDQQPAIMQEYMPIAMQRIQERSKALTDEMAKDMEELSKSMAPAETMKPPSAPAAK